MKTEAWWVCDKCNRPIVKKGKRGVKQAMLDHRNVCHEFACFGIQQVEQRKSA